MLVKSHQIVFDDEVCLMFFVSCKNCLTFLAKTAWYLHLNFLEKIAMGFSWKGCWTKQRKLVGVHSYMHFWMSDVSQYSCDDITRLLCSCCLVNLFPTFWFVPYPCDLQMGLLVCILGLNRKLQIVDSTLINKRFKTKVVLNSHPSA